MEMSPRTEKGKRGVDIIEPRNEPPGHPFWASSLGPQKESGLCVCVYTLL